MQQPIIHTQRKILYDQMPELRAAALEACQNLKRLDLAATSLETLVHHFFLILETSSAVSKNWSFLQHYDAVVNNKEYREQHATEVEAISNHSSQILLDAELYERYAYLHALLEKKMPSIPYQADLIDALELAMKSMKNAGAHLESHLRSRLQEIDQEMSLLSQKFSENCLDSDAKVILHATAQELDGLLPSHLELLKYDSDTQLYAVNRTYLCSELILKYATDRGLREKYYRSYNTQCGDQDSPFSNMEIVKKLLQLSKESALIMGWPSFRAFQVHDRFAKDEASIEAFYAQFFEKVPLLAQKEHNRLKEFAWTRDQVDLQLWDMLYYVRLEEESLLQLNQEELSEYFPVESTVNHMLNTFETLYNLKFSIQEQSPEWIWDESVRVIDVVSRKTNLLIGHVYMDLFQREGKRAGAWMGELQYFAAYPKAQPAMIYCVCNGLSHEKLRFEEVETLYHEFGHSLHGLLSHKNLEICSGINAVPWDIIELPSILSEQWATDPQELALMGRHIVTGEALSADKIKSIVEKNHYRSGSFLLRQMVFGFYDWTIYGPDTPENILEAWQEINAKYAVMPRLSNDSFPLTFQHIFSGGYSAGYYSYLWAEVYVHQVYKKMQAIARDASWSEAGNAFKEAFLGQGYRGDLKERLHLFLEDSLAVEPLLEHYGLVQEEPVL